ncbi:MAG: beta-ketoacyl synthase chain length factor [Algicola sp.]|nr:beta-ketoacyl synthase chain length factor [Algicola sp.]
MQFKIKNITALAPGLQTPVQWQTWATNPVFLDTQVSVPKLDFIPMMQRRRLSKFARLCCFTLYELTTEKTALPMVFVSRFGDLVKTNELIEDVVGNQTLSPTKFALSVHNAVAGQYSILTDNKQPSTTIAAGIDSFHMGLCDAVARLKQSDHDELIMVCTETITPEKYTPYITEQQIDHSVAILLSKTEGREVSLTFSPPDKQNNSPLPQALAFLAWYHSDQTTSTIVSAQKQWQWANV